MDIERFDAPVSSFCISFYNRMNADGRRAVTVVRWSSARPRPVNGLTLCCRAAPARQRVSRRTMRCSRLGPLYWPAATYRPLGGPGCWVGSFASQRETVVYDESIKLIEMPEHDSISVCVYNEHDLRPVRPGWVQ